MSRFHTGIFLKVSLESNIAPMNTAGSHPLF